MIKNTYFKVMNEKDEVFATVETRREAKTFLVKTRGLFSSNQGQSF